MCQMSPTSSEEAGPEEAVELLKALAADLPDSVRKPVQALNASDLSSVRQALLALEQAGCRLKPSTIQPFHVLACHAVREGMREPLKEAQFFEVRWLVEWLFDVARRDHAWGPKDRPRLPASDGEELVVQLWTWVGKNKELLEFLERGYRLCSRSGGWLLGRCDFDGAQAVLRQGFSWPQTLLRMSFAMPILAGTILGWLVLLQADEAIKYIFCVPFWHLLIVSGVLTLADFMVIYGSAAAQGVPKPMRRAARVCLLALLMSVFVGMVFLLAVGNTWIYACRDVSPAGPEGYDPIWWFDGLIVLLGWAPAAVFVGIFTQVVWTGRTLTEPLESLRG